MRVRFYSSKIKFVGLRKCPHCHQLTNKVYLSDITLRSIFRSFTHNTAAKTSCHRYVTNLRHRE